MDDIYYFDSPSESATNVNFRAPFKTKSKFNRKRRQKTETMYSQYACVARIDEQWFCPTGPSTLFAAGSISYATSRTESRPPTQLEDCHDALNNDEVYDHDSDDDYGGVPLGPYYDDDATPGRDEVSNEEYATIQEAGSSNAGMTANGRPFHPRPQTREMWEEEDGRRMRLALDGDSPHEDHEFDVGAQTPDESSSSTMEQHVSAAHESPPNLQSLSRQTSRDIMSALVASGSTPYVPSAREIESARSIIERLQAQQRQIDEDALAVDDPQRSYDFADFMDTWRLRSLRDKRLSMSGPAEKISTRCFQAAELVPRKDVSSGNVDMQGIPWHDIGHRREQATSARSLLHPSGTGIDLSEARVSAHSFPAAGQEESHYKFRSFASQHKANFSHYQLRNALTASGRNDVFFANGSKVMRASLACPTQSETAMDLSKPMKCAPNFRITCLSASPRPSFSTYQSEAVLLAGGFEGEFAMLDLNQTNEPQTEGVVTHAYNGLVTHIETYADRNSGLLRAAFCSNDSKVRLMDVRRLQFTDTFSYNTAVNCSATSADGRLRALVGDSCETIITDAEKGNPLVTLRKHTDHGFACAWSQDGRNVATGAQDGKVVVWDSRNWSEPLRVLGTSMSCARSLNFTDNGGLVVAENDDVVRVYDGGNFSAWQEIRFFGSIAGLALIDGGAEMVVANVDKTVGGLLSFERNTSRVDSSRSLQQFEPAQRGRSSRRLKARAVRQWDVAEDMVV